MKIINNTRFAKIFCRNCGSELQIDKEQDIIKTTKIKNVDIDQLNNISDSEYILDRY